MSDLVDKNRRAWTIDARIQKYQLLQGWIDDGERAAIGSVADEVRGQPVLDIGVGGGRTVSLMRLLTSDYVAIDWSAKMVAACRSMHQGVDVRQGDARDLDQFPPSRFKLVFFSYNGIDMLDHAGRLRVYDAVRRVLRPDGIFAYSTLSKDGPIYNQRPWFQGPGRPSLRRVGQLLFNAPKSLPRLPMRYANWWRSNKMAEDHGDWGVGTMAALDFNLVHFTTVDAERRTLEEHRLTASEIFVNNGARIAEAARGFAWFTVIARPI